MMPTTATRPDAATKRPARNDAVYLPYLANWRRWRLLSGAELAARVGTSAPTVWRAETMNGRVSLPMVRKLAAGLGISPDRLVYEDAPAAPNLAAIDRAMWGPFGRPRSR
jgi:transcriptional regulator with XRE-family HTH domain